jgi:DNA-binding transcriptional LysR family regulator
MSTIRQMTYWLAVVDHGSFTRAASHLRISQPSLSQQIRSLEAQLGGPLIERLPRGIRLTSAGKAFLPHARTAVQSAERAVRAARAALELETGELEISTVRSIAAGPLPSLIQSWRQRFSGTSVRLHEFSHRTLAEASVRDGLADIGIGPPPPDWHGPLCRLGWEEFVIVLPPDDPLAGQASVQLAALAQRDWVMFDPDHGLYDIVTVACATDPQTPFKPRASVRTSQVEAAARLAASGVGPALIPANALPQGLDGAVLHCDPPRGRELTIYALAEWTPLAQAFVELMQESVWATPPERAVVMA